MLLSYVNYCDKLPRMCKHSPCLRLKDIGMLTTMLLSYVNYCDKPPRKCKHSPCLRLKDRSGTMTERLMPFHWKQVTWPWLKLMPTRGVGKWRGGCEWEWDEELYKVEWQVSDGIPTHLIKNQQTGCSLPFVWSCELSGQGAPLLLKRNNSR